MIAELGFPLVVKPLNGNHGRGVKLDIQSLQEAEQAFDVAKSISEQVIFERYIKGHDFRFLVIDYKLHAVARRTPAAIIGDERSTIAELIEQTNKDPRRGIGHENVLTSIKIDESTQSILVEKNLTLNSVLPFGEILFLKGAANLSNGGTATDVTDIVHPYNVFLVERIARLIGLDICGIDMIAADITSPINKENGAVLEVNAGPGFRMHLSPTNGRPRNVAEPVLNMLFPNAAPSTIPIIAITGTNGKTTTTRLIAHMVKHAGYTVGYTTTEAIYIQDHAIHYGDCTGPISAEAVLRDPLVDFAVLETARGGILRSGLGFTNCDISIITNITEDHLGLGGIDTLEDLSKVKSVVAKSTIKDGFSILNADDDLVYSIRHQLDCNIALFSIEEHNERIQAHCEKGGWAAIIEKGYFTICKGEWKIRLMKVKDVPLTLQGKSLAMTKNILPSILAASIKGIDPKVIRQALETFIPGPVFTPGRMNCFTFRNFELILDYAHNVDGYDQLKNYLHEVKASYKIGVIGCAGDRRDEDIIQMGRCAANTFDEIIIRLDKDGRGRSDEEISNLFLRGISESGRQIKSSIIPDEIKAINHAVSIAGKGNVIVVCTDKVQKSIDHITTLQQHDNTPANSLSH